MMGTKSVQAGFTLIEVMVAMAIVAILAAFAIPAYTEYVKRGLIPEATNALADARVKVEQYFQDNPAHVYTGFAGCPGNTDHFEISCDTLDDATYTFTATGTGMMAGFEYSIDEANNKSTTAVPDGWTGDGSSCWVIRSNGKC